MLAELSVQLQALHLPVGDTLAALDLIEPGTSKYGGSVTMCHSGAATAGDAATHAVMDNYPNCQLRP